MILCFPFMSPLVLRMMLRGLMGNHPTPWAPTPIASSRAGTWAAALPALVGILLLNHWVRMIWLILNVVVVMIVVLLDWFSRRHILDSVVIVWGGRIARLFIAPVNLHGTILIVLQLIYTSAAQIPQIAIKIFIILTVMMMIKLRIKSVIKVIVCFLI